HRERMRAKNTLFIGSLEPQFLQNLIEGQLDACRSIHEVYLFFNTKDLGYTHDTQPDDPRVARLAPSEARAIPT
ncbi:MAG: hypothetical protein Q9206_007366, partial [Seirophora lacunosa]